MNVAIVGASRIGLTNAAVLTLHGHEVVCIDENLESISLLKSGSSPYHEHGLNELLRAATRHGSMYFSSELSKSIEDADIIFIAVEVGEGKAFDGNLQKLYDIGIEVASSIKPTSIVAIVSSVPVGTTRKLQNVMQDYCYHDLQIATCPDFFRIGQTINDALTPDRIIIGTNSKDVADALSSLFGPIAAGSRHRCPLIVMTPESAELTKLAASSLLAMKVSFVNEIASLCDCLGADIESVRLGMCTDRRIGWDFFRPSAGFGGAVLQHDLEVLMALAESHNSDSKLLHATREVNELQIESIEQNIREYFNHELAGKQIAFWGLAFKPDTDDTRFSPSLKLIRSLLDSGVRIAAHDPLAIPNARRELGDAVSYNDDKYAVLQRADALVIMTGWQEYLALDPIVLCRTMNTPCVFDTQNCLNRERFAWNAVDYFSIGQKPIRNLEPNDSPVREESFASS